MKQSENGNGSRTASKRPNDDKELPISLDGKGTECSTCPDRDERPSRSSTDAHDVEAQTPSMPSTPTPQPPHPTKVPRAQRRGLLGRLTLVAEVDDPHTLPAFQKWFITFIVSIAAFAAPTGSTILFPSLADIAATFDASPTVANLSVAIYMLALGVFPLFWSSFSESSGRRSVYVVSFALAVAFNVLSAISTNIAMFVVTRVLSGGAAASVQVVGAGTVADVWHPKDRGHAISMFYLGPLMGPMLAPTIGGVLQLKFGWRSNCWFLSIFSAVALALIIWCLPETLQRRTLLVPELDEKDEALPVATRTSTLRSARRKGRRALWLLRRTCIEPFGVLANLRFPIVACTCYYACITFGSLYVLNISVQATFSIAPYNFTSLQIGLAYLANSSGYALAAIFGGRWTDWVMNRAAKRKGRRDVEGRLVLRTEDRVQENAWLAAVMYPLALVWYGWTAEFHLHWAIPLVANFFFGIGAMLIFGMVTTMLTGKISKLFEPVTAVEANFEWQSSSRRRPRLAWRRTISCGTSCHASASSSPSRCWTLLATVGCSQA